MKEFILIIGFLITYIPVFSQVVDLSDWIPFYAEDGINTNPQSQSNIVNDGSDYYILMKGSINERDIYFDDLFIPAQNIPDTLENIFGKRNYVVKVNQDLEVIDVAQIANVESIQDFAVFAGKVYLTLDTDVHPIFIDENVIPTLSIDKGAIVVLNEDLEFEKIMEPLDAQILQIEVNENGLYLAARMENNEEYILIDQDTVFNYTDPIGPGGSLIPGERSYVLLHYDIDSEEFVWHQIFGSAARETILDFVLDGNGDILLAGHTNSTRFFTFNNVDWLPSSASGTSDETFLAKYSGVDGSNIWGFLTEDQPTDVYYRIQPLSNNDFLVLGEYSTDNYMIGDSILEDFNPITGFSSISRGFLARFGPDGTFNWVSQIDGDLNRSGFNSIAENIGVNEVVTTGYLSDGTAQIQNAIYQDDPEINTRFIASFDLQTGQLIRHIISQSENLNNLPFIDVTDAGEILLMGEFRDEVDFLGNLFSEYERKFYLLMEIESADLTGIEDVLSFSKIKVYPNPGRIGSEIQMLLPHDITDSNVFLQMISMDGGHLGKTIHVTNQNLISIDTQGLTSGVYLIRVIYENHTATQKVVLE